MGDKVISFDAKDKADAARAEVEIKAMKAAGYYIVDQTKKGDAIKKVLATKTKPKAAPKAAPKPATKSK